MNQERLMLVAASHPEVTCSYEIAAEPGCEGEGETQTVSERNHQFWSDSREGTQKP